MPAAWLAIASLMLTGCAVKRDGGWQDATTAPLYDLNVLREPIPEVLVQAREAPYARPRSLHCQLLAFEIGSFDEALGPDFDQPEAVDDEPADDVERAQTFATKEAQRAVKRTTESLVPFRSWVRRLSGAERHQREVQEAIEAGQVRRAFLKGLATARRCKVS